MSRLSPSSRLVLVVVVLAVAVVAVVGSVRPSPRLTASTAPPSLAGTPTALASPTQATRTPSEGASPPPATAPTATVGTTSAPPTPTPTPAQTPPPTAAATLTTQPTAPSSGATLGQLLAALGVVPEDRTGYDRSLFPHWIDPDGDGCDTRREVLVEESLDPVTIGSHCSLSGGRWDSLYDGVETTDPSTFDIDHLVPLAEAWDSGASDWILDRRTRFANDLDFGWSLIAVSASSNRSKGDGDPSDWLPPLASVRCNYVAMWLAVKVRWSLSIDSVEASALESDIPGCSQTVTVPLAP
jgi:Protein of unknown function (DUF1524)